jgi:diphthamide synthase (EF-2-diphthine--ammonia ligase)
VNFISKEFHRISFHGTEARLIELQSQAIGIPLLQKETTWDGYEQEFKEAIRSLIPSGVAGIIFGDIYLQEHKDRVEMVWRIELTKSRTINRDNYWLLDTIRYKLSK